MAQQQQQPALPWAQQQQQQQQQASSLSHGKSEDATLATNDLQPLSIDQLGLQPGARVEVRWHLEQEDDAGASTTCTKWWGATITGVAPAAADEAAAGGGDAAAAASAGAAPAHALLQRVLGGGRQQRLVYQISYDEAEGFEAESAEVLLLTEHELFDRATRSVLLWRREGDAGFDPPDDDDEEDEEAAAAAAGDGDGAGQRQGGSQEEQEAEGGVVTAADMARQMEEDGEEEEGTRGAGAGPPPRITVADMIALAAQRGSSHLPRMAALAAAADEEGMAYVEDKFQDFMANFKEFIAAKMEMDGRASLEAPDVREFVAMMQTQRQSGARGPR